MEFDQQAIINQMIDYLETVLEKPPMGLTSFGGHPQDTSNIQGVHTRQEPFINLTIQSQAVLQIASEQLARTSYYQHWSAENLSQVGFHDRSAALSE